ncbi:ADAM 17-like protease [Argonauta hians]
MPVCCIMKTLLVSVILCSLTVVSGNINEKLFYFETLKVRDVRVITRRSVDNDPSSHLTLVYLQGLGRQFNFYLHSTQRLLSSDFSASTVDSDGHETPVFINRNAFYEGALQDDKESHVDAVWEDDDLLATITTSNDTYTVEPSWRHLPGNSNHTMIIYKGSDIKSLYNNTGHHSLYPFCGYQPSVIPPEVEFENYQRNELYEEPLSNQSFHYNETRRQSNIKHDRRRRYILTKDTCEIMLVADYTFFKNMGSSSVVKTINYMMLVISTADSIFRSTLWDEDGDLKGMGLKVVKLRIHTAFTYSYTYNADMPFGYKNLLREFCLNFINNKFCLVHLFTYRSFDNGVVGLSFTADTDPTKLPGGICANLPYQTTNAGFSSTLSEDGYRVLLQQAEIITIHGHNWGATHDPEKGECAPSTANGGKYIMSTYAVTGKYPNNWFRPCCNITSHNITSHLTSHLTSHHISHHITSHNISHHITSHITSHHITSHHITSHITSHHITSHHITSHHITSHITSHLTSHHITSHLTSHHITSHITSHHITSHITSHHIT